MSRDLLLILVARLLRACAFGMSAVVLGLQLERLGLSSAAIGVVLTIGLLSAALGGVIAAAVSARIGRRVTLAIAGGLMALAGIDLALASAPALLALAAATGMLGAANVDFGAYASIEQAALAESVPPRSRTLAFARYSLTGGLAAAVGSFVAGSATNLERGQLLFAGYAIAGLITAALALMLSSRAEAPARGSAFSLSEIRSLAPLSAL